MNILNTIKTLSIFSINLLLEIFNNRMSSIRKQKTFYMKIDLNRLKETKMNIIKKEAHHIDKNIIAM